MSATTIGAQSGTFSHLKANNSEPTPKGGGFFVAPERLTPQSPARTFARTRRSAPEREPDSPEREENPSGLPSQTQMSRQKFPEDPGFSPGVAEKT
jgi:hypothetical protein